MQLVESQCYEGKSPSAAGERLALNGAPGTCATNRKVTGLIPDVITPSYNCTNPSGGTMVLGVDTAPNNNECREYSWGKEWPARKPKTSPPSVRADCPT
jgi:hypothetical protein